MDGNRLVINLIALLSLSALAILTQLGTYWFVFGIWPHSWLAFLFFGGANLIITNLLFFMSKVKS